MVEENGTPEIITIKVGLYFQRDNNYWQVVEKGWYDRWRCESVLGEHYSFLEMDIQASVKLCPECGTSMNAHHSAACIDAREERDPDDIFEQAEESAGATATPSNEAIAKLATDMTVLNDWCKTAHAKLTAAQASVDTMKQQLYEWLMVSGHSKGWKFDNGINLAPKETETVFKAGGVDNGVMIDWLNAKGLGDIVKETVHFSTLSATLLSYRETLEDGQQLPEIFNLQVKKTVHFRGNGASQFLKKYHEEQENENPESHN